MRTAALSIFALSAMASAETATLRVISNAAAPGRGRVRNHTQRGGLG